MIPDIDVYNAYELNPPVDPYLQRALWHDYHSHRMYMITMKKHPGIPDFSIIKGEIKDGKISAVSQTVGVGFIIERVLKDLNRYFPQCQTIQYKTMPDHLHTMFWIHEYTEYHLDELVDYFQNECNRRYRYKLEHSYNFVFNGDVFIKGYNDRIVSRQGQKQALIDYIRDNPRRLFLRKAFPWYFNNGLVCVTDKETFGIFGNVCLLEHPDKVVVKVSRWYTKEELAKKELLWKETIRNGGVLVSPFIHPHEKDFMREALESGGKIIYIVNYGFAPRWKPSKSYIDATSEGRILFVGNKEFSTFQPEHTREISMRLNNRATEIAALQPRTFTIRKN